MVLACSHSVIANAVTDANRNKIQAEGDTLACAIFLAFERYKRSINYKDCGIEKLYLNVIGALRR